MKARDLLNSFYWARSGEHRFLHADSGSRDGSAFLDRDPSIARRTFSLSDRDDFWQNLAMERTLEMDRGHWRIELGRAVHFVCLRNVDIARRLYFGAQCNRATLWYDDRSIVVSGSIDVAADPWVALRLRRCCRLVSGKLSLSGSWTAIGAGLSAAIMYGFAAHMTKRYLSQVDPMVIAAGSSLSASLLLAPISLGAIPSTMPSISSWIAVAVLGLLCTGIAYFIYFRLLRRIGPGPSMTVAYLIPMFGVLWGGLFLSEPITWNLVVGGGLVLSGVYVMVRGARTASPAK